MIIAALFTTAVPNLFGTREQFCGRQFFQGWWVGVGRMVQAVMRAMGSGR